MQGTIASLQDAVSKLESSLREEKTLASGQVDIPALISWLDANACGRQMEMGWVRKRILNPFDMSQGKVDRDDEIVQTLKSHLLEIEREQQGQASKLLEQERILSACRCVLEIRQILTRDPERFVAEHFPPTLCFDSLPSAYQHTYLSI